MIDDLAYKWIYDDRSPKLIKHSEICYPPPHPDFIDRVDTTYPGIVVEYPNGYQIEDGVHRIAKLQREGIYESLFYVVTRRELRQGMVCMTYTDLWGHTKWCYSTDWVTSEDVRIRSHDK